MNSPLISVIIPVYKVENYLNRCVESVVNQTYNNLEIILVDDGSPDLCPQFCVEWAKKDARIRVIHKENGGLSSARNAGLDICRGAYVGFVDSDDWIEPHFYDTMFRKMQEYQAQIGCAGRYDVDEETLTRRIGLCPTSTEVISSEETLRRLLTWQNCDSSVCDKLFLASLWKDVRFPIGRISEDVSVTYKIVGRASCILMVSEPMYHYFHRKGSITTAGYSSKNVYVVTIADEICSFVETFSPTALVEARYFKLKTLLHWHRAYTLQINPSQEEKKLYSSSRLWLLKQVFFVLFGCKYVRRKDKLWYLLIVLGMKRLIRRQLEQH